MSKETTAEDIKRRIEKLLAIAEDKRANEHQAASAYAKAQSLMAQWGLKEWERSKGDKTAQPKKMVMETVNWLMQPRKNWEMDLSWYCADAYDCKTVVNKTQVHFMGPRENVDLAVYAFQNLRVRLQEWSGIRAAEYGKQYHRETGRSYVADGKRRAYIRSWLQSAVYAIGKTFSDQKNATKAAHSGYALMIVDQEGLIEAFKTEQFGELKNRRQTKRASASDAGREQGWSDGRSIEINKAIADDRSEKRQIGGE